MTFNKTKGRGLFSERARNEIAVANATRGRAPLTTRRNKARRVVGSSASNTHSSANVASASGIVDRRLMSKESFMPELFNRFAERRDLFLCKSL